MLTITRPMADVIHVHADGQYELTSTFVRPQEFYESAHDSVRGKYGWSVEYLASCYQTAGKPFDYFSKWNGFNIPGRKVCEWFANNFELTPQEQTLSALLHHAWNEGVDPRHFYLIGTWREEEIDHELAHALFYLDHVYKNAAMTLIQELKSDSYGMQAYWALERFLLDRGYSRTVLDDEIQAYLSEAPKEYWHEKLGPVEGDVVTWKAEPFRKLLKAWLAVERL